MTKLIAHPAGPPAAEVRPSSGGIGGSGSQAAEHVSDALRRQDTPHLRARRRVALLQFVSNTALGVVGSYQFGLLRRVPEPSLPGLGADAVDASGEAYQSATPLTARWASSAAASPSPSPAWAAGSAPASTR
jgi:hypothetical protein